MNSATFRIWLLAAPVRVAALLVCAVVAFYVTPVYGQTAVNAQDVWLWNLPIGTSSQGYRSLAIAPTGSPSLIATGGGFRRIDLKTGAVLLMDDAAELDIRSSVWVSAVNTRDLVVSGYENRHGYWSDGTVAWHWLGLGCCNVFHTPFAIDLSTGRGYTLVNGGVAGADLSSGTRVFSNVGSPGDFVGYVSIATPTMSYTAGNEGLVTQFDQVTGAVSWSLRISTTQPLREGAIAADGSLVVTTGASHYGLGAFWPFAPGELARVRPDGTLAWKIAANAQTAPVIGSQGLIFVGTQATTDSVGAIQAYSLSSGALVWSANVDAGFVPSDLLVGNDGLVYAVAGDGALTGGAGSGELLAFDQATGARQLTVTNVPGAFEIILFDGIVYVTGPSISAIPVSATGYDPHSPWPVRFHDNQRTGNLTAPIEVANHRPVADAGPDQNIQCAQPGGTPVTLDGSASMDPDPGDPLTFEWRDSSNALLGSTPSLNLTLPLGMHTFSLTVTDGSGASTTDDVNITVQDTTPPVLNLFVSSLTVVLPTASATSATADLSSIATATDACDASVTITDNAPALFPIGATTVTFTARDASFNSTTAQLLVRVAYNFGGFLPPVRSDGSSIFRSNRTVPVKFQLTAADGSFITDAVATLQVFKFTDVILGTTEEVTPDASGSSNLDNLFRYDAASNQYIYNLSTAGYAPGTYLLRVTLNDGTAHEVQISVRD